MYDVQSAALKAAPWLARWRRSDVRILLAGLLIVVPKLFQIPPRPRGQSRARLYLTQPVCMCTHSLGIRWVVLFALP